MRRFCCLLLTLVLLASCCLAAAETPWNKNYSSAERNPDPIEIVPWDSIPENLPGQHHYLLLCIDQWQSHPRPKDAPTPTDSAGNRRDLYGNTDGMVILTLDTRAKRIMLTSLIRDSLIRKPNSTEDVAKYGRLNYVYNDYGPEALCKTISEHLGIRIEKYVLFNFGQIQDIIDLDCFDGVDLLLNTNEISYLAKYAVPRNSVVKADGYFSVRGDPLSLRYVSKTQQTGDFSIPASAFSASGRVPSSATFEDPNGTSITFDPEGVCVFNAPNGESERCTYSYKNGRLVILRGPDVWHNVRAPEGLYHFSGHPAVLYMRIRKSSRTDTDFMRTQRVRNVLSALADKCRVFSLDQANDLANSIMEHNDATNMNLQEMLDAASMAYGLRDCTIEELRIPAEEDVRPINYAKMSAEEINWTSARQKLADFLEHTKLTRDIDYLVVDDDD